MGSARPSRCSERMRAVRYDEYGDIDVLDVRDVEDPVPAEGEVLVRVKASGINPGESKIREGMYAEVWPSTFPSGQGSDFAGVVLQGAGGFEPGDEVIGFTHNRAAQAELLAAPAEQLTKRPAEVPWEQAGALFVVGSTAWAAVRALALEPGDTVAISGAAGGVGTLAVQLARRAGANVIGLASEHHHDRLRAHGATPLTYGDGLRERLPKLDAFIDTFGEDYVDLALELGVPAERINTIIPPVAERTGVKSDGNMVGGSAEVLAELAQLIADGELELPIQAVYPLDQVREAYTELSRSHSLGKIVLTP